MDELMKLQKQLSEMPLIPLDKRLRNKRDKLETKIHALAVKEHRMDQINLFAGRIN